MLRGFLIFIFSLSIISVSLSHEMDVLTFTSKSKESDITSQLQFDKDIKPLLSDHKEVKVIFTGFILSVTDVAEIIYEMFLDERICIIDLSRCTTTQYAAKQFILYFDNHELFQIDKREHPHVLKTKFIIQGLTGGYREYSIQKHLEIVMKDFLI